MLSLKDGREEELKLHERTAYVLFMIRSFQVRPAAAGAERGVSASASVPVQQARHGVCRQCGYATGIALALAFPNEPH